VVLGAITVPLSCFIGDQPLPESWKDCAGPISLGLVPAADLSAPPWLLVMHCP
jgi:hypothetical protein